LSIEQVQKLITVYNENGQISDSHGFDGTKPTEFGKGFAYHLMRVTGNSYKIDSHNKIARS
jgi:hypothetical protein